VELEDRIVLVEILINKAKLNNRINLIPKRDKIMPNQNLDQKKESKKMRIVRKYLTYSQSQF
jgi:hypothetical protein